MTRAWHVQDILRVPGSNWREALLELVCSERLPKHWGGELVDENGDEMCRAFVTVPPGKVPIHLYWRPAEGEPAIDDLDAFDVRAGDAY